MNLSVLITTETTETAEIELKKNKSKMLFSVCSVVKNMLLTFKKVLQRYQKHIISGQKTTA
jgi:hypothetical protein